MTSLYVFSYIYKEIPLLFHEHATTELKPGGWKERTNEEISGTYNRPDTGGGAASGLRQLFEADNYPYNAFVWKRRDYIQLLIHARDTNCRSRYHCNLD